MSDGATSRDESCAYCGLPVIGGGGASFAATSDSQAAREPAYCCYGCRFAASIAGTAGEPGQASGMMSRLGLAIFFSMNVMVFTMFLWSQPEVTSDVAAATFYSIGRYLCLLFSLPVLFLLGGPLMADAENELRRGRPSLNLLLMAGVLAAFGYSAISVFRGVGHVYFEVSCTVLVAVTLGRWLEATGKLKTTAALRSLEELLPETVHGLWEDGTEVSRPLPMVAIGDQLRVFPGERIPVDGVVRRNVASIDQQAITGESVPVVRGPGDDVFGGTLNLDGDLIIEATSSPTDGVVRRMIDAVSQTLKGQARYQRLAERISAVFLPVVAIAALAVLVAHGWWRGFGDGLLAALSVVVIACPCALGLATPMALWSAVGRAARAGVLLRDGDSLSKLAAARSVCFDKTGTLTTGTPEVIDLVVDEEFDRDTVLRTATALAASSRHPMSMAIVAYAKDLNGSSPSAAITAPNNAREQPEIGMALTDVRTLAGRGVVGWSDELGTTVFLGSQRLAREMATNANEAVLETTNGALAPTTALAEVMGRRTELSRKQLIRGDGLETNIASLDIDWATRDESCTVIGWGGRTRGMFRFKEHSRSGVTEVVDWLKRQSLCVLILTGDHCVRGERLSRELNVETRAELLPEDKLAVIRELGMAGPVVMVGDGINDAPSLAAADVGVSLGSGTDVSRYSASICLLRNDLSRLPWLIELARQTERTIRWNLAWSFAYNIAGVGLAAAGLLNPIFAAGAMAASSLLVVTNSLRLGMESEP